MASVGQTSIARCAAAASASFSGCLKKYTAVSSSFVFRRLGAASRQVRHIVQVVSTYHAPGTFRGCLLFLSAMPLFYSLHCRAAIFLSITAPKYFAGRRRGRNRARL